MAEVLRVVGVLPIRPNIVALLAQWFVRVEADVLVAPDTCASQLDGFTFGPHVSSSTVSRGNITPWFRPSSETVYVVSNRFAGSLIADLYRYVSGVFGRVFVEVHGANYHDLLV